MPIWGVLGGAQREWGQILHRDRDIGPRGGGGPERERAQWGKGLHPETAPWGGETPLPPERGCEGGN